MFELELWSPVSFSHRCFSLSLSLPLNSIKTLKNIFYCFNKSNVLAYSLLVLLFPKIPDIWPLKSLFLSLCSASVSMDTSLDAWNWTNKAQPLLVFASWLSDRALFQHLGFHWSESCRSSKVFSEHASCLGHVDGFLSPLTILLNVLISLPSFSYRLYGSFFNHNLLLCVSVGCC